MCGLQWTGCAPAAAHNEERRSEQDPMIKATKNHSCSAWRACSPWRRWVRGVRTSTPAAITRDASFVGYSNPTQAEPRAAIATWTSKSEWKQTKHANAWADMQATVMPARRATKCHTTAA